MANDDFAIILVGEIGQTFPALPHGPVTLAQFVSWELGSGCRNCDAYSGFLWKLRKIESSNILPRLCFSHEQLESGFCFKCSMDNLVNGWLGHLQ